MGDSQASDVLDKFREECDIARVTLKLAIYFAKNDWRSVDIIRVEKGYYDRTLSWRMGRLNAPSEGYLCKSMIMENTAFKPQFESRYYQRYYCVIIQYITKMSSEKLLKAARAIQNDNSQEKVGKSGYNLRLLNEEESSLITGYGYNGVTPFLFNLPMPILLSQKLEALSPQFFFLGGGHADLKLSTLPIQKCLFLLYLMNIEGVSYNEFTTKNDYDVYPCDISDTERVWNHLQE